jgi:hypothetical protein
VWLASGWRFVWSRDAKPFVPVVLVEHVAIYVPAVRMVSEARLTCEPLCGGVSCPLGPINADQLGIVAILIIGPDVLEYKNGFHVGDIRRRDDGRYWVVSGSTPWGRRTQSGVVC